MTNPVLADLTNAEANAVSGVLNTGVGINRLNATADDQGDPNQYAQFMTAFERTWELLARLAMGTVIAGIGLSCDAFAQDYRLAATAYNYPGGSIALPASDTHYLYLDAAQTLKSTIANWPNDDVYKLAIVTTDATNVTNIKDARWMNFNLGVNTSWYNVIANAAVDFGGQDITNFADLKTADPVQLTIAASTITPTQMFHTVDTQDNTFPTVSTITADPTRIGRLLFLQGSAGTLQFDLGSAGNVSLPQDASGAITFTAGFGVVVLVQDTATTWTSISVPQPTMRKLDTDLDANLNEIHSLRGLNFFPNQESISAGNLGASFGRLLTNVTAEAPNAFDDLDTVTSSNHNAQGPNSDLLILQRGSGHIITVKHNPTIADGFNLQGGRDMVLGNDGDLLMCFLNTAAVPATWQEIARFPRLASDLAGTDEAIYTPITIHLAGIPAIGTDKQAIILAADVTIKSATMYADTAPTGGDAVVDILIDGLSMFVDQSEMPHVLAGANSDVSAIKNKAVLAGQRIQLQPELINTAADITITLHAYAKPQTPPT